MNSTQQSRIRLKIEEVFIISNQVQADQLRLRHHVDEQFSSNSRRLVNIMDSQSDFLRVLETTNSSLGIREQLPRQHGDTEYCSPYPIIGIRTYIPQLWQACSHSCQCNCHRPRYVMSPRFLKNIIGALFLGYAGFPFSYSQKCTDDKCLAQSDFRAYINYFFPFWLFSKAMTLTFMLGTTNGPCMALTVRRIVSNSAEIFRLSSADDAIGLQQLLSKRLASPNDLTMSSGNNALLVCLFHFVARAPCT